MNLKGNLIIKFVRFWPPYLFSGIKMKILSKDFRHVRSTLKFRFWNANVVGTQFGGSIYSMTDPVYMLMLMKNLGNDYSVWDKSATIKYLKPGRSELVAEFILTEEDLELIRKAVKEFGKMDWIRTIEVKDTQGTIIAEIQKMISIKSRNYSAINPST